MGNNLYSQNPPKRFVIGNITIKKGTVVIGGFSEVATVTSISEVANLAQNHKNIIKKLIITGTNYSDLAGIATIGADDGALPNLESIELKNMENVPGYLFYDISNNWLESFSAPEAKIIENGAFVFCYSLTEINLSKATDIGERAFLNCPSLTKLTLGGTNVTVGSDAFGGGGSTNTGQVDLYLSEEEYNTVTGANHNEWENKTWKSITKIVK